MKSIAERAKEYSLKDFDGYYTGREKAVEEGYIAGATEQKKADIICVSQFLARESAYNGSMTCIDDLLIEELCKAMEEEL